MCGGRRDGELWPRRVVTIGTFRTFTSSRQKCDSSPKEEMGEEEGEEESCNRVSARSTKKTASGLCASNA